MVRSKPVAAENPGAGQIRNPKPEIRNKFQIRSPKPDCSGGRLGSQAQLPYQRCTWLRRHSGMAHASPSISVSCAMHKGVPPEQYRSTSQATPVQCRRGTGLSRGVRAFGRLRRVGLRAETRRKGHCRELWRGS
jgi:hypothetical protein